MIEAGCHGYGVSRDTSKLLIIPAEIRRKVYEVLFADSYVEYTWGSEEVGIADMVPWNHRRHQILLSCHKCYSEASPIFWKSTMFNIDVPVVSDLLLHLPAIHCAQMRRISCGILKVHFLVQNIPYLTMLQSIKLGSVIIEVGHLTYKKKPIEDFSDEELLRMIDRDHSCLEVPRALLDWRHRFKVSVVVVFLENHMPMGGSRCRALVSYPL